MIQTALLNYFNCNINTNNNEPFKQSKCKPQSFKQANLTDYFKIVPKKKNLILDYFKLIEKKKEEKENEEKVFDLVLVDIKHTAENYGSISCIKKNMYNEDLKYIAISYRWGEVKEQWLKTPDYIAHITSFHLIDLMQLCLFIKKEPDLKEIRYLWVDAISVNQQNHSKKKETILKMNQIYKRATYILAVPDLHKDYLLENTANVEAMGLIYKYKDKTYNDIINTEYPTTDHINTANYSVIQSKENDEDEELKKAYKFLSYLIRDWSNRTWVISEFQIAREKYEQHGTPLKYIFLSLFDNNESLASKPFFSYTFGNQNNIKNENINYNKIVFYGNVDNSSKFINFFDSIVIQRPHLDMILISKASRNEDRFYAILPSWDKYKYLIKNKNNISEWNITSLVSVKLKLFEIMDDLWDRARLLHACTFYLRKPILPSFASYNRPNFILNEIDEVDYAHEFLLNYLSEVKIKISEKHKNVKEYIKNYKNEFRSIFKQNLIDIQFNQQRCYLSVKANQMFVFNTPSSSILSQEELSDYLLEDNESLKLIYIPFFTFDIPEFSHLFLLNEDSVPILSGILLLGNMNISRWIFVELFTVKTHREPSICSTNGYIFNIY